MANTVWALLSHPAQYEAVCTGPNLLTQAIGEAQRWEPPVQSCTRFVTPSVTVRGIELAAGEMVQCMVGAANRDSAYRDCGSTRHDPAVHVAMNFAHLQRSMCDGMGKRDD